MTCACGGRCGACAGGVREVVHSRSAIAKSLFPGTPKALSFEQLVRPVQNGPLAQRIEPAKVALTVGVSGYGVGRFDKPVARQFYQTYPGIIANKLGHPEYGDPASFLAAKIGGAGGRLVKSVLDPIGSILFGGGFFGGGVFKDESAEKRAKRQALYQQGWNQAKYIVTSEIQAVQRRLDTIDRDLIALDATLQSQKDTIRSAGPAPQYVLDSVQKAVDKRAAAQDLVDALKATEDQLNAAAAAAADGEKSGNTSAGSPAQVALDKAKTTAEGVDDQIATVKRGVDAAVMFARSATEAVNRWVDSQNAKAQALQQQHFTTTLTQQLAQRLSTPPPGFVYGADGGLAPIPMQVAPPILVSPYVPMQTGL